MPSEIYFEKKGSGISSLIFLHGFPMNHEVWTDFTKPLEENFSVYTPDLPGFGRSSILPGVFSIDDVGTAMLKWMEANQLRDVVLIGHSMGGYVALSMIRSKPEWFKGLVLFHSTATADNQEKKQSRSKVIEFIDQNGVQAFTSNFIQPLFADPQHPAIPYVKNITVQSKKDTVKGYTLAMRDREDRTDVLKNFGKPIALIGGDSDKGIPVETLRDQGKLSATIGVHVLENCGHMGMFEHRDKTQEIIRAYLLKIFALPGRR